MKLLVCGGRDYQNYERIIEVLDSIHGKYKVTMLIEGGAKGADAHAATWADNNKVFRVSCPANWNGYGKGAGPVRNAGMLTLCPDGVVAFPGGSGTQNMINQARKAGVKVVIIE